MQVHHQTQGKEMEGRGLNVTQTGNNALCSLLLSGAHERFIPNFALVQAVLCPTQHALPGAYITGSVERY